MSAALLALSGQGLSVASLRDRAIALITYAVNRWGERAAAASVDFFDETMEASGIDVRASMPSGIFSADEISRIGHYQAGKLTEDNYQGFVDQIAQSAGFLVYQAGPRTMFYQGGRGVNGNTPDVGSLGQEAYIDPSLYGGGDYQVRYQRIPQGLETCDFCLMLASRGAVYLSEESAGGDDPDHFHRGCVVAGTKVSGTGLLAGFEREYQGSLVHLATAGGHELTVTPNHPILTNRGWVRADALKEGDYLVCAAGVDADVGSVPDDNDAPPSVEDVVVAGRFAHATLPDGMPPTAVNLDGSPIDGKVDVVSPDGFLASGGNPALYEEFVKGSLAGTHLLATNGSIELDGAGTHGTLLLGADATLGGLMSGGGLCRTLLGCHFGSANPPRLGATSLLDSGPVEPAVDNVAGDAETLGDGVDALATLIRFHDSLGHLDSVLASLAATALERPIEDAVGDAKALHEFLGLDAGLVELDQLVTLDVIEDCACHVYNLHTQDSMYVANGIITHNCDCLIVPALCHYDYGKLVQDTQFEGYDTKAMYDLWQDWADVSASGLSREEQTARKLDLMEQRIGRRDWTYG